MGHIRDRMDADLRLAGRSESTRIKYMGCARLFVKHFMRSPELLGEEEVRQFLLLLRGRPISVGYYLQFLGALKFLFAVTLGRPEVTDGIPWPKMRQRRLDVMTREEVARVFAAASTPFWRAFLTTAYGAGMRRMEVAALRAQDIDRVAGLIRVPHGKGDTARDVMLDPELHLQLRAHLAHPRADRPVAVPRPHPDRLGRSPGRPGPGLGRVPRGGRPGQAHAPHDAPVAPDRVRDPPARGRGRRLHAAAAARTRAIISRASTNGASMT